MNIFEAINKNIVDLSEDMVAMFKRIDTALPKLDAVYSALYPTENIPEAPKADGATAKE